MTSPEQQSFVIYFLPLKEYFLGNLSITPMGAVIASTSRHKSLATTYKDADACAIACEILSAAGFQTQTEFAND